MSEPKIEIMYENSRTAKSLFLLLLFVVFDHAQSFVTDISHPKTLVPVREHLWSLFIQKFSFRRLEAAVEQCVHAIRKSNNRSSEENVHPIFLCVRGIRGLFTKSGVRKIRLLSAQKPFSFSKDISCFRHLSQGQEGRKNLPKGAIYKNKSLANILKTVFQVRIFFFFAWSSLVGTDAIQRTHCTFSMNASVLNG